MSIDVKKKQQTRSRVIETEKNLTHNMYIGIETKSPFKLIEVMRLCTRVCVCKCLFSIFTLSETTMCLAAKAIVPLKLVVSRNWKKLRLARVRRLYYIPYIHISMQSLAVYQFVEDCDVLDIHYSGRDCKCSHIFSIDEPSPEWIVVRWTNYHFP